MRVGVWFYGLATAATGILDIVWGAFEASHQPIKAFGQHVPGQQVLAYIAGVWLVAAGMAILWRRTARIGAAASAMIYLIFALFWLPRFYVVPHTLGFHIGILIFIVGGLAQQLSWPRLGSWFTPRLHPLIRYGERDNLSPLVGCWDLLQSSLA